MKELNTGSFNKHRRILLLAFVLVAAAAVLAGGISARYVRQEKNAGVAVAKEFYFTSDLLGEDAGKTYTIDGGTKSFAIKLFNYADELRVTADDIEYKVTVENGTVTGTGTGTLSAAGKASAEVSINIQPSDKKPVVVTATSTSPYKKVLTATFNLASGNRYMIEDAAGNTAAVLTITCTDIAAGSGGKVFTITLPEKVVPDATDSRVAEGTQSNTYTFTVSSNGIYSLVLLKKDTTLNLKKEDTPLEGDAIEVPDLSAAP